ncbi:MAG TPA: type 4a pilus biogenesis protein PilO [Longimicrobiales bacterium]
MPLLPSDPQQQKKLLLGVIPLLLLGAYTYFFHGKYTDEVDALERRLENLESKNAAAKVRASRGSADLEAKLALYEQHIARLEELVPSSEEVPQLIYDMALRAQESGVELMKTTPDVTQAGPYYTLQTYEVAVFGAYHDIARFLVAIGTLPRIVTPFDLQLTPRPDRTEEGEATVLQADFSIKTYVLPEREPATPEASSNART